MIKEKGDEFNFWGSYMKLNIYTFLGKFNKKIKKKAEKEAQKIKKKIDEVLWRPILK